MLTKTVFQKNATQCWHSFEYQIVISVLRNKTNDEDQFIEKSTYKMIIFTIDENNEITNLLVEKTVIDLGK